jgi:putative transposase
MNEQLTPGGYYHICSHAVGSDCLFLSDGNYTYFIRRYQDFIPKVADTLAFCLMPNHVHLLVQIHDRIDIPAGSKYSTGDYISKQFANLFSSYAQAFNKQNRRKGTLFRDRFTRQHIDSDEHLTNAILYIHRNPVTHGFVTHISDWKYSSYNLVNLPSGSFIEKDKVISWFGNLDQFNKAHQPDSMRLSESFSLSES